MTRLVSLILFSGLMVVGLQAHAQSDDSEVQSRFYDFNDMLIDGEFQRPEGMFATERGQARFDSLLNLRRSFIEEINASAEEDTLH